MGNPHHHRRSFGAADWRKRARWACACRQLASRAPAAAVAVQRSVCALHWPSALPGRNRLMVVHSPPLFVLGCTIIVLFSFLSLGAATLVRRSLRLASPIRHPPPPQLGGVVRAARPITGQKLCASFDAQSLVVLATCATRTSRSCPCASAPSALGGVVQVPDGGGWCVHVQHRALHCSCKPC